MLQRINRSLAPHCLATPEGEEHIAQARANSGHERSTLEIEPSITAAKPRKQKGSKQRNNNNFNKASQRADQVPCHVQPHPQPNVFGRIQSPPCTVQARPSHQLHSAQRPCVPMRTDSLMGPVPSMPISFPQPLYAGPFNYPPPPLNHSFGPPPFGPVPFSPQAWQQGHRPSRPQFFPRNAPPQPRTSSPIPGPRRSLHHEGDYGRWIKRLEEGGSERRGSAPVGSATENRYIDVANDNVYQHQVPLDVPFCLPPRCDTVVIPVGFLPNGCYGPIPPTVFQCPAPMYPGNVFPAPVRGPVGVPMLLNRPFSEADV